MLKDYKYLPKSGKVESLIVFLHGFGADGQDLISLSDFYSEKLPNTAFYSPTAPDVTPMGMGHQWFNDNNWTFKDKEGIETAKTILEEYITELSIKHKIEYSKIAVVSFSQGSMTSLYALPRFKNKLAGLVAFSGIMMWHEELKNVSFNKFPVLFYHGKNDDVVDFQNSVFAEKKLDELGFTDTDVLIEDGLEHGISLSGIEKSSKFLKRIL